MICTGWHRYRARVLVLPLMLLSAGGSTGCGNPLEVDDPTAILESDVNDAMGAELLRRGALRELYTVAGSQPWYSGLLADEFTYQAPMGFTGGLELLDRRNTAEYQQQAATAFYGAWQTLRMRTTPVVIEKLSAYAVPGAREAHIGEMVAMRGYAALRLAEDYCPGFPLHEVVNRKLVYGPPRSTEQALEYALAQFDSAASWAVDSARVLNFARVGRARTLLHLGRFAEAAAAAIDVPKNYVYQAEFNATVGPLNALAIGASPPWGVERSVANREGGTGLDFAAAKDPRVPRDSVGPSRNGGIIMYRLTKYPTNVTPIVLASGIEARLIEAEAALRTNPNDPQWLTILNALRTTCTDVTTCPSPAPAGSAGVAGLPPLTDPGTTAGRVDLVFRERAFWLFATGTRLGDLRRLVRVYGRPSESVFPTGAHWQSGAYGAGTSLGFSMEEIQYSPGVTGCTG